MGEFSKKHSQNYLTNYITKINRIVFRKEKACDAHAVLHKCVIKKSLRKPMESMNLRKNHPSLHRLSLLIISNVNEKVN